MKYVLTSAIALAAVTLATTIPSSAQTLTCKYPWDINRVDRYCHDTAAVLLEGEWEPADDLRSSDDDLELQQALGWRIAEIMLENGGQFPPAIRWLDSFKGLTYFNFNEVEILGFTKCTLALYGEAQHLDFYDYHPKCAGYVAALPPAQE